MLHTGSEKNFWKAHSMGCGYHGEFKRKQEYPEVPVTYECPKCGSEYRPEQELNGDLLSFMGDSVDMFRRVSDEEFITELKKRGYRVSDDELIEELKKRGYKVEKRQAEFWKKE